MYDRLKCFVATKWAFLLAFFAPILLMGAIYAFQGVFPFGDSSLLTIDLGQQYIDFYAEYRHTLLEDPSRFFYSFTKSLGGEMIGVWAYYLTSPLNLLFLLFPPYLLDFAVTLLTLLKIGLMGLSCSFYLHKTFGGKSWLLSIFSISYAMMGYTVVYQLNLMWLDGIILLPLVALGVERLLKDGKGLLYSLVLALILFANYYIGYMICLFLILYFIYRLPYAFWIRDLKWDWRDKLLFSLKKFGLFVWHSILGAGLSAFLLLPAFISLLSSKADYTNGTFEWELAYPIQEIVSKFVVGAFNFDQMPSGHPNLFIGSIALILFLFFFFNHAFPLKERIFTLIVTIFFILSVNVEALNKVWHAMQFPVWFPYRFSFVFSFFMIMIGYRSAMELRYVSLKGLISGIIVTLLTGVYIWQADFEFLTPIQIVISCLFSLSILILLSLKKRQLRWIAPVLLLFALTEMTTNAAISLSRLGYVRHTPFTYSQYLLDEIVDPIQAQDEGLYRIEKTFHRSKNDSHQANYNSVTHFSSTYESDMPIFFGKMGLAAGNGYSVYSNGTLFTDAFFGIKYYISDRETHARPYHLLPNEKLIDTWQTPEELDQEKSEVEQPSNYSVNMVQTKPDVHYYPVLHSVENLVDVRYNPFALPVGFASDASVLDVPLPDDQPIQVQNELFKALRDNPREEDLFVEEDFSSIEYDNVIVSGNDWNRKAEKINVDEPATITFQLETNPIAAYYLTFNPSIKEDDVNLLLNGETFYQYETYYDQLVLNLAGRNGHGQVTFQIEMEEDTIDLFGMQLYRLDFGQFSSGINDIRASGITVLEHGSNAIKATARINPEQELLLFTIPFDEGWQIEVDGEPIEPIKVLDSLLGIPLSPGTHELEMTYRTPYLTEGILISLTSAALLTGMAIVCWKKNS